MDPVSTVVVFAIATPFGIATCELTPETNPRRGAWQRPTAAERKSISEQLERDSEGAGRD
jgi:hypothetical protein